MTTILLNFLTFGILLSTILSITSNNPVISIIFLITAFVNAAGLLILMGINFIGISYIVIYVGAIAVLFLFIILMINIKLSELLETGRSYTKNLPLGLSIVSLFLFIFYSLLTENSVLQSTDNIFSSNDFNNTFFGHNLFELLGNNIINFNSFETGLMGFNQMEVLGHILYTYQAILLIVLSLILLLAMLAIIVISKNTNKKV